MRRLCYTLAAFVWIVPASCSVFAQGDAPEAAAAKTASGDAGVVADGRGLPSLKIAAGDRYKVGVGVSHTALRDPRNAALITRHFEILTPENCMKPQSIHPAEDQWQFEAADSFADFARQNGLEVVGHTLVWAKDDRTDPWMMKEADGRPVTRETLLRRIEHHVQTVVGRYADVATMWDVVNEAVGDGDEGLLRDSIYSRTAGMDFIATAYAAARAADPDALLIYNDYNDHLPDKRAKILQFLKELRGRGVPIDAFGLQGHFEIGDNSVAQTRETLEQLRGLGMKAVVSELDIDVVPRGGWWADGGARRAELEKVNPYPNELPAELQQQLADHYAELFKVFNEYEDIIERVSFWNPHDGESWLNYFPWERANHPLLFDRQRQPKPAFEAVIGVLSGTGR